MSSNTDTTDVESLDRKIEMLSGRATDEHLEALREKRAQLAGDGDCNEPVADTDVVEALSRVPDGSLSDAGTIDEAIERREEKLEALAMALPRDRVSEVRDEIEALETARDVASPYRTNTPEALAARIEVRQR